MAEMANAYMVCSRDPAQNLNKDKTFMNLFQSYFYSNLQALTLEHHSLKKYIYIYIYSSGSPFDRSND